VKGVESGEEVAMVSVAATRPLGMPDGQAKGGLAGDLIFAGRRV
jgi:hypothetical protein